MTATKLPIPEELKEYDHWVLWGVDSEGKKRLLAPWLTDHLYPVEWGSQADERPETDWETAAEFYKHRHAYPAPDGIDVAAVKPAPILLHDPLNPPLMMVDFDDVRDPESGEISDEVKSIVDRLEGYTEVSQSGEGLHTYVRAELPGGLGKFIGALEDIGDIELYDHGRTVGSTWQHVDGSPMDVPHKQETIEEIIKEYETESQRKRRITESKTRNNDSKPQGQSLESRLQTGSDDSNRSVYFDIDIESVADTGYFSQHRDPSPGDRTQGPHPAHGPIHSSPEDCTNFGVDDHDNLWNCFAHGSGGRAIELAAVLCPETAVSCNDVPQHSARDGWLCDHSDALLTTCVWLREQGVVDPDETPPYAALVALSRIHDLHIKDEDSGILGESTKKIAHKIYKITDLDDL